VGIVGEPLKPIIQLKAMSYTLFVRQLDASGG
jgi:hypothetical protein